MNSDPEEIIAKLIEINSEVQHGRNEQPNTSGD
jgi:hypothetical protein